MYLRWKEQDLLALSPLVRLLWGSLIDELVTTYDQRAGNGCQPVMLLIDEAGRTAIPSLADHATTVVGRGISIWLAVQSLSQLEVVYGKARAQVVRDNMESQLVLPTHRCCHRKVCRGTKAAADLPMHTKLPSNTAVTPARDGQSRSIPLLSAYDFQRTKTMRLSAFINHDCHRSSCIVWTGGSTPRCKSEKLYPLRTASPSRQCRPAFDAGARPLALH